VREVEGWIREELDGGLSMSDDLATDIFIDQIYLFDIRARKFPQQLLAGVEWDTYALDILAECTDLRSRI
jgi:hypothetical protein